MTTAADLPSELKDELDRNAFNPCVGKVLLSDDERARVWFMHIAPGERVPFHRHVLDYFWTCLTHGTARSHINGGAPVVGEYAPGQTRHLKFAKGEFMVHDLENIGQTDLVFVTVEHKASANAPLPLPASVKPQQLEMGVL